jgi:5-methylcytosine-specific restriction protein A
MPNRPPVHVAPGAVAQRRAQAQARDRDRRPPNERGYDWHWRKFRIGYLSAHPLCMDCEKRGVIRAATEPHHIVKVQDRPDLRLVDSNLMALCHDCHATRTGRGE